jgi:protein-tyrosine phosphatase
MLIDVHSHLLPFVDDGSDSLDGSIDLIKKLELEGVSKIILTPHYKHGVYKTTKSELKDKFDTFCSEVKSRGLNVQLYLGQEVFCDEKIYTLLKNKEVLTINDTNFILLEFDYFNYSDILDYAYNISQMGYVPVIAHIERYRYLDADTLIELHHMGALLQINASSVIGEHGKKFQKRVFAAIKSGLVHFVATDIHKSRECSLNDAYKVVCKKFGKIVADNLFINNAQIFFE